MATGRTNRMTVLRRNCLSLPEGKESSWSDDEDCYHQNKRKGEAPRRVQEEGYVLLDQSDDVGGYYCARHAANPTEDNDDESNRQRGRSDRRRQEYCVGQEESRERRERRTDSECE